MIRILTTASCLGLICGASPGWAQETSTQTRDDLMARCAQIESDAARLACFDMVMRGGEAAARRAIAEAERADPSAPVRTAASPAAASTPQSAPPAADGAGEFGRNDGGGLSLPGLPSVSMPDLPGLPGFGMPSADRGADLADAEDRTAGARGVPDTQILERDEDGDPDRVLMVVERISTFGYNTKRFHMANGQVWEVTDGMRFSIPRNADPLTAEIRTAGGGGYFMRLQGEGRAIRVRRID